MEQKAIKEPETVEPEKEDGEVSSDESHDPLPHRHLLPIKTCAWTASCRNALGNYDMFQPQPQPQKLPLLPTPPQFKALQKLQPVAAAAAAWPVNYESRRRSQPNDSFDRSLQELKQVMRSAGYKLGQRNIKFVKPKSSLEFNDLDTDPYYTNKPSVPAKVERTPEKLCPPWMLNPHRIVRFKCLFSASSSSSSSTDDFTSTTDSSSSSSASSSSRLCSCKRKLSTSQRTRFAAYDRRRQRRLLSSSSSDSDKLNAYSSSTDSSELSSSSSDQEHVFARSRAKFFYKRNKKSSTLDRRRREFLQQKLQAIKERIARKKRRATKPKMFS